MSRDFDNSDSGATPLEDTLSLAFDLILTLGPGFQPIATPLADLASRLREGRFHLAVLGQFKRGKSTLLNALMGQDILPTGVVPLTAIPTWIRHGPTLQATVHFQDDHQEERCLDDQVATLNDFLARFATEAGNPGNHRGVARLEITHPAPILADGVVLIDTPGVGSTFRHNTEATLNFLPQCDAALFLLSADPPITEVEVEFLKRAKEKVSHLFFVLNKVDYLAADDLAIARGFLHQVLVRQVGIDPSSEIFCVSARQALTARTAGNDQQWRSSGLATIERELIQFLADKKSQTLRLAVMQKACDLLTDAMLQLQISTRSLKMPLRDLQHRLDTFEHALQDIARQRESADDLLAGDRKRTLDYLEELAADQRTAARLHLTQAVTEAVSPDSGPLADQTVHNTLAAVIPGYFEHQSGSVTELITARLTSVLTAHQNRAAQLISGVRATAANLFDIPFTPPMEGQTFHLLKKPDWVTHQWSATLSPIPRSVWEHLLPPSWRKHLRQKRVHRQIEDLVIHNVENLRWAIYQSINESFRHFGTELDAGLRETLVATHGAIKVAMDKRQQQSSAVDAEIVRLESASERLAKLLVTLEKQG